MLGLWGALWLVGVIQLSLGVAQNTLDVAVTVDTTRSVRLTDSRFLSISVPPSFLLTDNYSSRTKSLLQGLSPCYLRVGGLESDMLYFGSPTNVSNGATFTMNQWETLQKLADDAGVSLVFTANSHPRGPGSDHWDPSDVLALLQRSSERGLRSSPAWQLGYAADMSKRGGSTVGQDVTRLRKALDLFPSYHSAAVLGPDFPSCVSPECLRFLRDFLLQSGDVVSALVLQSKPECDQKDEEVVFEKVSRLIDDVDKKIVTRNGLQSNDFRNIPKKQLWFAETGAEEYTGAFTDALVWALRLGHTGRLGYDVLLRRVPRLDQPTPDYWVSLLYRRLVGRAVLDVRPSSRPSVMLFTHCTTPSYPSYVPGAVTVWGVNAAERGVSVKLPHSHNLLYTLTAGTGHRGSTLLNGEELKMTREASLPELRPHDLWADRVFIPAFSVFYIVLLDLQAPACLSAAHTAARLPHSHDSASYITMTPASVNSASAELLSGQGQYDIVRGGTFGGHEKYGKHYNLEIMPPVETMEKDSIREVKFKNPTQSALIDHVDLIRHRLKKRNVLPFRDGMIKEPQTENVVKDNRFKRSEFNQDHEFSDYEKVEYPLLNRKYNAKQRTNSFNIFKKFQQIYKNNDDGRLRKAQQDLLASKEDINIQDFNNKEADIHYFPGEFYNKLRNFLSKPNERLSDIEDPHEAVATIAKYSPEDLVQDSELRVTKKLPNSHAFDRRIVEQTTEKMESYYNQVAQILNEDMCENAKHRGKMNCCIGKLSSPNDHTHETMAKHRLKREINYDQTNETSHPKQFDYLKIDDKSLSKPLDEAKLSQLLKELTAEGEQLLKSIDQDYERTLKEHKLNSEVNLLAEHLSENNKSNSNVGYNLTVNKMNIPKTNFPINNTFSSTSKTIGTFKEAEVRSKEDISLSTVLKPSLNPDLVKMDENSESKLVISKIDPEIKGNTNLDTITESINTERQMEKTSMFVDDNRQNISEKKNSERQEKYPTPSSTNNSQQRTAEQIQMDAMKVLKFQPTTFSTNIGTVNGNYQHDRKSDLDNSKSSILHSQTNQMISPDSPIAIEKQDSKTIVNSEDANPNKDSMPQLKQSTQSYNNILSLLRLQENRLRPAAQADGQLLRSAGRPQPTILSLRASNARKQRLEEYRARLENMKKRIISLAKPNITNRNAFEREMSKSQGITNLGRTNLFTPNLDKDSHQNEFVVKEVTEKKNVNDYTLTKPRPDFSMIDHLINSRSEDIRKPNNTFPSLENNSKRVVRDDSLTEDATLNHEEFAAKPERVQQESNSETIDKVRHSRSIQNPCIRDRFNDFETDVQESRLQKHINIQPLNEQTEVKMLNKTYVNNKSTEEENVDKNSLRKSKSIASTKLKRSIDDIIKLNEVETADIITNEINKQTLLHGVSSPDNNLFDGKSPQIKPYKSLEERFIEMAKKYSKTNPSSLEIFSDNFKENMDATNTYHDKNENEPTQFIDIANTDTNGLAELKDFTPFKEYDSVPTVKGMGNSQDMGLRFQERNIETDGSDVLKNYAVSAIIKNVSKFFKKITSVISSLSQTKI